MESDFILPLLSSQGCINLQPTENFSKILISLIDRVVFPSKLSSHLLSGILTNIL